MTSAVSAEALPVEVEMTLVVSDRLQISLDFETEDSAI
jgi:hypothetical protein